jgi:hypothetical protein
MMAETPTLEELAAEVARLKAQPERIIIVPREKNVRKFSGGHNDIELFKADLESLWGSRKLSTKDQLESIRDEVRCYPKDVQENPDRLLAALEISYGDKRSISQLLSAFYSIRQGDSECVREFSHRLKRSFDNLCQAQKQHGLRPLEETFLRDHFIEQLNRKTQRACFRKERSDLL